MTEEELKIKFDHIQGIFNRCINHASQVMIDNIASKSLYFDAEQADKLEQQEYVRTTDWKSHATLPPLAKQDCPLWLQYD